MTFLKCKQEAEGTLGILPGFWNLQVCCQWLTSSNKAKCPGCLQQTGEGLRVFQSLCNGSFQTANTPRNKSGACWHQSEFSAHSEWEMSLLKSILIWEHRFGLPPNDMLHHASSYYYFGINYRTGHYKLRNWPCILNRSSERLLTPKPGSLCYRFQMLFDSTLL